MPRESLRNTHDLADYLQEVSDVLRAHPSLTLADLRQESLNERTKGSRHQTRNQVLSHGELTLLAGQIAQSSRSDAETRLTSLTVKSIQKLAPLLDIRIPSRATKMEYVQILLTHLFDAPAGHKLIRTFHERRRKEG